MIRKIRDEHWMSISDLMSGLMIVFMLIAIAYMVEVDHQHQKQNEVREEYAIVKHNIYVELYNEFEGDLPKWNAELDEKTLAITFKEPDVLFATGSDVLNPQFKVILDDFLAQFIIFSCSSKHKLLITQSVFYCVFCVLFVCTPFQIFDIVIFFISIYMIYARIVIWIWQK